MDLGLEPARAVRAARVARFPDGTASIIARRAPSGSRWEVFVVGPRSRALFKATHHQPALSIHVRAGHARRVFGVPASALTDRILDVELVWNADGRRLADALTERREPRAQLAILERAALARARSTPEPATAALARRALQMIDEHAGACRVDHLADQLGVTPRHLRRVFADSVGLGPKELGRMIRLRRALGARRTAAGWAAIAVGAGYYDQAHLITECHALVGMTPADLVRQGIIAGPTIPGIRLPCPRGSAAGRARGKMPARGDRVARPPAMPR